MRTSISETRRDTLIHALGLTYLSRGNRSLEVAGGCSSVAAWSQLGAVLSGCLGAWRAVAPATRTDAMRSILIYGSARHQLVPLWRAYS